MEKLLIAGVTDDFSKQVKRVLSKFYEVIECEFHEKTIERNVRLHSPRLFVGFSDNANYGTLYKNLRESFSGMGIVIVCESNVVELQMLFIPGFIVLNQPLSTDDILDALEEMKLETESMKVMKRILTVDDNSMILRNVKEILGNDYEVAVAPSGKKAFEILEKKIYDLVLLDYEMPEMSGLEIFRKIKKTPAFKDIPVIFLTGVQERDRIMEVVELKPAGYILKPLDSKQLRIRVRETIGE